MKTIYARNELTKELFEEIIAKNIPVTIEVSNSEGYILEDNIYLDREEAIAKLKLECPTLESLEENMDSDSKNNFYTHYNYGYSEDNEEEVYNDLLNYCFHDFKDEDDIRDIFQEVLETKQTDREEFLNQDIKIETSAENTKMIMDFLDKQLDVGKSNKDLSSSLEDDLTQSRNRREVLLSRGINKIDVKDISFDEKNTQIDALHELSLDQLEDRYGKKSEELESLTNNSTLKIANSFVKTYKGKTKDEIQVSNAFEEFIEKKAPKIIDEQVENSDIFKSYQEKMSKYVRESKPNDSPFMKLLNYYANLPAKILEEQFKEGLRDNLKQEMLSKKDVTLGKIQDSFKDKEKSKKKSKGMER